MLTLLKLLILLIYEVGIPKDQVLKQTIVHEEFRKYGMFYHYIS